MANTEAQLLDDSSEKLVWDSQSLNVGQRLTIPNRQVVSLSFKLLKLGTPSGTISFAIRTLADVALVSKSWGDVTNLTTTATIYKVVYDEPVQVDEEVRIVVMGSASIGPNVNNCPMVRYQASNVKANELFTYHSGAWLDNANRDCWYSYEYYDVSPSRGRHYALGKYKLEVA